MLTIGDKAPEFDVLTDDGSSIKLKDLKGQKVVLYFYPKDDTPGCTKEACSFRDEYAQFKKKKVVLLGVSGDTAKKHLQFKEKFQLPFPLLVDEGFKISSAYGVYKQKSMYGRTYMGIERSTFVIDESGKIEAIFPKVKVDGHTEEVLAVLGR